MTKMRALYHYDEKYKVPIEDYTKISKDMGAKSN